MFIRIIELILIALGLIRVEPIPHHSVSSVFINRHEAQMDEIDEIEWSQFWFDAAQEYGDEFTALFNSTETKWSKNNRLMIRSGNSGSYRFAKGDGMRYQVWYGYAIKSFYSSANALEFASKNDGQVIDTYVNTVITK